MQKNLIQFLQYSVVNPNMRLGQAFCNFFNITDSRLFHEVDQDECWEIIIENYFHLIDTHSLNQ